MTIFGQQKKEKMNQYYVPWILALEQGGITFGHTIFTTPFRLEEHVQDVNSQVIADFQKSNPSVKVKGITCLNFIFMKKV